jgi:CHAT domain-containing protein
VQALLRPNEAMVVYAIGDERSWLWVVRPGKAEFIPLKADLKSLTEHVKAIRAQMELDGAGKLQEVDVASLHVLYQGVFEPAVPHLAGVRHIMLVPAGPLQSLPFGILVASPPSEIESFADYRQVDWLAKRYALSVLPSVSSIRAFRQFAKAGVAQEPFIGFGDPLLSDEPGAARLARAQLRLAGLFRNPLASGTGSPQADVANVRLIKQQARLPETADEIKAMAAIVRAGKDSIWLQDKATESNVKKLDLSRYRIVAFATHGVMAGELGKEMEPGLLLTPPAEGTPQDDGYLAAGEIARLKLNADWVLLSACNTAAADGSPGAEGLSGLAKAFFYAGSRSLLVSHWPVASEATLTLTTTMLREHEANPKQGKAVAHRKAMLAMMNTPKHPEYAHPLFWAPFVIVGEGSDEGSARGN